MTNDIKVGMLPMNLQFFAEETPAEETDTTAEVTVEEEVAETVEETEQDVDADKIVDKLQKRLGNKTKEAYEAKEELNKALERISELEKGASKSVKAQSDDDKTLAVQEAKDIKIKELEQELKTKEITSQVDEVLKESGFALNKEELSLLVAQDEETSYGNIKTFIGLINRDRQQQAIKRNTGDTPKKQESPKQTDPFEAIKNKYK